MHIIDFLDAAPAPTESSIVYPPAAELLNKADVSALKLLSNSLESVFDSPESSYSDAKLVLSDGREVSFHRFVLSARSPFFKNALAADNFSVKLKLKEIAKDYEVGYDSVVTVLAYVYSSRVRPPPKGVSECADEDCCHVACRPAVDFMLEVLYLAFVFQIPELVTLYQRQLLDVVDKIVIEDTLAILKLANICGEACKNLLDRCRDIVVKSDVDIVSLDKSLPEHIVKQIVEIRKEFGLEAPQVEKHVSKILEQAEKRGPIPRDVPPSLEVAADELKKMRLCVEIQEEQAEKRDPIPPAADVSALQLFSNSLESVFDSPESFYSDAKLVLSDSREVPFHRCILSSRSPFFKTALATATTAAAVKLELKEIAEDYEVGFDSVVTVLGYVYSSRVRPPPKGVSECADENCRHVACRPAVDFMLEVLYLAFVFEIPELVTLYQRHLLDLVDKAVIEDTLVILKLANICGESCKNLLDKCRDIIVKSDVDVFSLDKSLPERIVKEIIEIRKEYGLEAPEVDKNVSNILKALDSDDVELVELLLSEGHTNLDDAYALHFAVAYCDVKTATYLLDLKRADVNHRNPRGYTVLHVAAMRKEPQLILSLLSKGANASETSLEGSRSALLIAKQVTKAVEYNNVPEQCKNSHKGGLCVEMLEHAEKRDPSPGDVPPSLEVTDEQLKDMLLDLENRVAIAQRLFPTEAQAAMEIAQMNGTCEFIVSSLEPGGLTRARRRALDVNIAPFEIIEEHKSRLNALSRTVELGKTFFPRCSAVLDGILDSDDLALLAFGEEDTPENRLQKKQTYMEIRDSLMKVFSEDTRTRKSKSRCFTVMAILVVINLLLEIASAVADQLSSIHKPYLARISLVMSVLSLVLSITDFTYKIRDHKAHFRCKWPIPWFYYPSRGYNRIFGSFIDMILLFCVVGGLIVSTINYSFIERRRDGPIKVSIWPLFFAIGMVASKFMEKPTISKDDIGNSSSLLTASSSSTSKSTAGKRSNRKPSNRRR